jgi:hypothetical protein
MFSVKINNKYYFYASIYKGTLKHYTPSFGQEKICSNKLFFIQKIDTRFNELQFLLQFFNTGHF